MYRLFIPLLCLLCFSCSSTSDKPEQENSDLCKQPEAPAIPSGRRATEEEINAAIDAVKDYHSRSDGYRACLKQKSTDAESLPEADKRKIQGAFKSLNIESHDMNAFVDEMLNREVGIYKELQE